MSEQALQIKIKVNASRLGKKVTRLSLAFGFRSSTTKDVVPLIVELLAPFHVGLLERVVLHDLVVVLVHLCKSEHFVVAERTMSCVVFLPEHAQFLLCLAVVPDL